MPFAYHLVGHGQRPRTRLVADARTLQPSRPRRARGCRDGTPAWRDRVRFGDPTPRFRASRTSPWTHLSPSPMCLSCVFKTRPLDSYRDGVMLLFMQLEGVSNYHMSYQLIAHRQAWVCIRKISAKESCLRSVQVMQRLHHLTSQPCTNSVTRNIRLAPVHLDQVRITVLCSQQRTVLCRTQEHLHSTPACHPL